MSFFTGFYLSLAVSKLGQERVADPFRKFPCHNWYFLPVHIAAKIIKVRCLLGSNSVSGLEEHLLGEKMVKLDKSLSLIFSIHLKVVWYLKKGKDFEVLSKNFYCWKRSIFHLVLTPQFNFSWKCYLLSSIYSFLRPGLWLPGATGLFLSCLQWRNNPTIVVFARTTIVAWQGTLCYPVHDNDHVYNHVV